MGTRIIDTEGVVLRISSLKEKILSISLLTPQRGIITCYQKRKVQNQINSNIGLFDIIECSLSLKDNSPKGFLNKHRVIKYHSGIGTHYRKLNLASKWSQFVEKNFIQTTHTEAIYKLSIQTFLALSEEEKPEVTYFKSLYLAIKEEGYPIKEEWVKLLTAEKNQNTKEILSQPIKAQAFPESTVNELTQSLESWAKEQALLTI